jgi:hypothetical protein
VLLALELNLSRLGHLFADPEKHKALFEQSLDSALWIASALKPDAVGLVLQVDLCRSLAILRQNPNDAQEQQTIKTADELLYIEFNRDAPVPADTAPEKPAKLSTKLAKGGLQRLIKDLESGHKITLADVCTTYGRALAKFKCDIKCYKTLSPAEKEQGLNLLNQIQ